MFCECFTTKAAKLRSGDDSKSKKSHLVVVSNQIVSKCSVCSQMVDLAGALHSPRTQNLDFSHLSNIIVYQNACNTIIKQLLLNREDPLTQLQLI